MNIFARKEAQRQTTDQRDQERFDRLMAIRDRMPSPAIYPRQELEIINLRATRPNNVIRMEG